MKENCKGKIWKNDTNIRKLPLKKILKPKKRIPCAQNTIQKANQVSFNFTARNAMNGFMMPAPSVKYL